jgi:uncharacterized membrane protein YbaN (DUF454 family)
MRFLWLFCGHLCLGLALLGLALPLVPTVPFLIAAAAAYERSSPRFRDWLEHHPQLGPLLRDWRQTGSIPPRAKSLALIMLVASLGFVWLTVEPVLPRYLATIVLIGVGSFIISRPNGPRKTQSDASE